MPSKAFTSDYHVFNTSNRVIHSNLPSLYRTYFSVFNDPEAIFQVAIMTTKLTRYDVFWQVHGVKSLPVLPNHPESPHSLQAGSVGGLGAGGGGGLR
jgi:hypothetical protein